MPPTVYLVRHGEAEHNVNLTHGQYIRDACLTALGYAQCLTLSDSFPHHALVDLVVSSPLRRTIQTAVLAFGPVLKREEVKFVLTPLAQEVSGRNCNIGWEREELGEKVRRCLKGEGEGFDVGRMEMAEVCEGWNSKEGKWAPDDKTVRRRAKELRGWLFDRTESHIVVATHGAFLHYLTDDWDGHSARKGTAWANCELRTYNFTKNSKAGKAHLIETDASQRTRLGERDPTVLAELDEIKVSL